MIKYLLFFSVLFCCSCNSDTHPLSNYYNTAQQEIIATNIITYIAPKAPNSTSKTRFQIQYKKYYQNLSPNYKIENYFIDKDSTHYFFMIRPVGNLPYKRGVLGKFKLDTHLMPHQFEEIVNTPHLDEKVVKERGNFLFKELIKNKNLDKYLALKHYVEWPDARLVYDKITNEWNDRNQLTKSTQEEIINVSSGLKKP